MNLFRYRPLHIPLIEALPEKLFSDAPRHLGQLSLYEQEQEAVTAKVIPFPMAQVVELHTPDNIQLGAE